MKDLYEYTKKRFPILPALSFSMLFGFVGIAYVSKTNVNIGQIVATASIIFLFLLRIRLWDEIKDFNYDSKHHGARPVQKGILSLPNIKKMALAVLVIEFLIQFFLPYQALVIFFIALIYSFLMFKNFYIKDFENKSFAFCLLAHQIIFFIYIYYIFSVGTSSFFLIRSSRDLWMSMALFLPPLIYEIGRKVKHRISHKGYKTDDTYIYRWGETRSYMFLFSLFCFQILATFMIFHRFDLLLKLQLLSTILIIFLYLTNKKKVIVTSNKWSIAIGMYGFIVLSIYLL
jgi:4-hydroxybenzoate polyprenyltransferase